MTRHISHSHLKRACFAGALGLTLGLCACSGEDRSDEQPRVPVVATLRAEAAGDSCVMAGQITESHRSSLRECGFVYGMPDSSAVKLVADSAWTFSAVAGELGEGRYYCVAYARNGMGTATGDTVWFTVE